MVLLLGNWPRILARTSSGFGASSTVDDCLKEEPLVFFAEARREDDESFETRDNAEDPLVLSPGLWGARYGPRELVRWGSGEMERLFGGGAALPGCWPGRRSSHIANQAPPETRREEHAGAAGNSIWNRITPAESKGCSRRLTVICRKMEDRLVALLRKLRCLQETLGIVECAPGWLGKWMMGASNWRQRRAGPDTRLARLALCPPPDVRVTAYTCILIGEFLPPPFASCGSRARHWSFPVYGLARPLSQTEGGAGEETSPVPQHHKRRSITTVRT